MSPIADIIITIYSCDPIKPLSYIECPTIKIKMSIDSNYFISTQNAKKRSWKNNIYINK